MHEVSPLRGSHHTPVHPTGVDTPACVVTAPMGLGTTTPEGMHTHCDARKPRRGDYSTGTGANPCVIIIQARVQTRVYDVGTEQEPRRGDTCV